MEEDSTNNVSLDESVSDDVNFTIDTSNMSSYVYNYSSLPGTITISSTASSGSFLTSNGLNGTSWSTVGAVGSSYSQPSLKVTGNADFDGDVKIQGHSIVKLLKSIEDRLAILQEPTPEKLEKFAALKKAYDHYKTLERLIGDN
jgi:hypothetical protein